MATHTVIQARIIAASVVAIQIQTQTKTILLWISIMTMTIFISSNNNNKQHNLITTILTPLLLDRNNSRLIVRPCCI
jgi:hypothetical protein